MHFCFFENVNKRVPAVRFGREDSLAIQKTNGGANARNPLSWQPVSNCCVLSDKQLTYALGGTVLFADPGLIK